MVTRSIYSVLFVCLCCLYLLKFLVLVSHGRVWRECINSTGNMLIGVAVVNPNTYITQELGGKEDDDTDIYKQFSKPVTTVT